MDGVKAQVVRWISDEPQPGWVEVHLIDAHGVTHSLFDKPPIFESVATITSDAHYPIAAVLDCDIAPGPTDDAVTVALRHGVETSDGKHTFEVRRDLVV
ncbi:hypothetical protein [Nocardioides baekrokdamisoli]|nr:hypothetical protein [Nocardioides baekrokdamisoli]